MTTAVWLYRVSGGRIGNSLWGPRVLLVTVPGRRSGIVRTVPVCYFPHDGEILVVGSANGSDREPQWFTNLRHASTAEVEIGRARYPVRVRIAERAERDRLWSQVVTTRSAHFRQYPRKTDRLIPIAALDRAEPA
ncbi:MAG: nitroreductase/quinone reductase family protein [Actinomycetales bacterium]